MKIDIKQRIKKLKIDLEFYEKIYANMEPPKSQKIWDKCYQIRANIKALELFNDEETH